MLPNEEIHKELKRLGSENFHLKHQLKQKNRQIKNLKRGIRRLKDALNKKEDKPKFKNGKRGTMKNG